ncbi:OPT family oligopeptide transporter [Dermatophilus congolensis]|uniref:Oligopeptide transporter, OPT family n=1 Tax=Dermatophilus congolensis TaxID=1863 RepID=A0AA46H1F5_9MICO|nr:oligopeptide transporter, OPT family [Dermatophilus congolensis]MBO3143914.1 oligopeptide transporter, OPT family [Dermatophilus congolensis]MBO3152903.1 oligopeptide transporter, OPT family [Dermatophilus congolensis]MBO3160084.1 oligopeptide transporter, OPT family [Dermatophilus congolensis]MBO3164191.1 oligopeptide transporter, OPT family [Dermatophilus congolensis]MBO3177736.1 oligopeptide transporter, OPT family [Dermatophilus congolensis]
MTTHTPTTGPTAKELTLRGIIIGGIITLVFTAANVYLGLKVGLTFATSIPAAVISMAILRYFADHTVTENNIVQTIASAAGTLSAIIFVLPGLVMLGYWSGFPYWTTAAVCFFGGVLGVMYSIPLRRALVTGSDLPYPEGVAAAEVLRVGDTASGAQENQRGLTVISAGALSAMGYILLGKLRLVSESISRTIRIGSGGTIIGSSLSLALIGVGHLVGITVGIAMIIGLITSHGILLPILSPEAIANAGNEPLADTLQHVFKNDVRMIGAGAMAVAALWTLLKIIGPIIKGITGALAASNARALGEELPLTERDIPIKLVATVTMASMLPIGAILWLFTRGTPLQDNATGLIITSILFILIIGLFVASVCGYMAGLIGASNSPISGVGIIVAIAIALLIKTVHGAGTGDTTAALVGYTLFTTAIVFGVATISNDNLQDLKTGQLVGATPWKQQVALIIGVAFGSLVIPPILHIMNTSFGFVGAPGAGPDALAAPQASLISTLAKGVLGGDLNWGHIGLGAALGVAVVIIDETLRATSKNRLSLPPLATGMGMYLPISLTLMIPIGALLGMIYDRWAERRGNPESAKRLGVLMATGLIVGESLFGVLFAGIVATTNNEDALAILPKSFEPVADIIGVALFAIIIVAAYTWIRSVALKNDVPTPTTNNNPT